MQSVYYPEIEAFVGRRIGAVVVFVTQQLDTRRCGGACPHTSFDDPTTPPDAPPRRSVEVRLMAAFAPVA